MAVESGPIYSFIALCVFLSCLQWDYKWKRVDNLCGQVGPNLIISFQSGLVSLCTMFFFCFFGETFLIWRSCCLLLRVCVYGNACIWVIQEIILVLMILNFIECMSMGLESCSICNYRCCKIFIIQYYEKSHVLLLHLFSVTNHWIVLGDINCCIQC